MRSHALRATFLVPVAILVLSAASCSKFPDVMLDQFEHTPQLEDLDFSAIETSSAVDYWELRSSNLDENDGVVGAGGRLSREEIDPDLLRQFDETRAEQGFGVSCAPVQTDRFFLQINKSADVRNRASEVWERNDNACI